MATDLQQRVWRALSLIPKGSVTTYGRLAEYLGTKAVRAVASAVGKNPNAPEVPCHRVVRKSGEVGQYSAKGGQRAKIKLLKEEGIDIKNNKIQNLNKVMFKFQTLTKV